ncbi:MAG: hypothetical protein AVDCRST_MAG39-118 [uncultured Sphingomonadaceae bacterium]|uniref:Uncharacterized protein n=1 Tax=uncultured Sphingomonadaceae bacterium TaxID=169976 RepID=A0A6J4S0B6_9SPHN|nr:MAG: hypothetical protein AVDCRST_MAG39-118 [uncultured Sphingomonadaceae bacterium]
MRTLRLLAATAALAAATPAAAATTVCSTSDITPDATACAGFFDGYAVSGNAAARAVQSAALAQLDVNASGGVTSLERLESFGDDGTPA